MFLDLLAVDTEELEHFQVLQLILEVWVRIPGGE